MTLSPLSTFSFYPPPLLICSPGTAQLTLLLLLGCMLNTGDKAGHLPLSVLASRCAQPHLGPACCWHLPLQGPSKSLSSRSPFSTLRDLDWMRHRWRSDCVYPWLGRSCCSCWGPTDAPVPSHVCSGPLVASHGSEVTDQNP